MSLTVTVQKGHDFSSGNVTRAALNAGAVPTVSVTGAVGTTELIDGAITDAKVGTTAGILLSKLSGQTADDILVVSATAGNPTGTKEIKALPGYLSGAIKEVSNEVEITPSNNTIISDKLLVTADTNVVAGLTVLSNVAIDDYVMVHDTSETTESAVRLKKATINSIQKVGTTEYDSSTITPNVISATAYEVTVDMDGDPFQTITLVGGGYYKFIFTNPPTTTLKTVTVRIVGPPSGGSATYSQTSASGGAAWPAGWDWPERTGNVSPTNIIVGKVALLSVTYFGSDVIAAYVVTD
jgi:hypothetical protein